MHLTLASQHSKVISSHRASKKRDAPSQLIELFR